MGGGSSLSTADLLALAGRVVSMSPSVDDAERIDRISHIESLKSALDAAQAVEAVEFEVSQRAAQAAAGVPVERQGRGVAHQIGLARRVSPWQAQRWLGFAKIVTAELPATFAELAAGRTSAWRAMLVARETAMLTRQARAVVDSDLAPHLAGWGDKKVDAEVRKAAYRADPEAVVARARTAEAERRVSLRPAPDTMCRLTALLPVTQGVAAYGALHQAANSVTAVGDERGRGQVMADTLVERVTGLTSADGVGVEIVLVMNHDTLLGDPEPASDADAAQPSDADDPTDAEPAGHDAEPAARPRLGRDEPSAEPAARPSLGRDEPAWIQDYGPVPAGWARELAYGRGQTAPAGPRWLRRLYTHKGRPVELESTRRLFTDGQQRFLRLRDQTCRTPWCDAPIQHADHIDPHDHGGPTHTDNGQGLCMACNFARQALGWISTIHPDGTITTHTPTRHHYNSPPPTITGPPGQAA